MNHKMMNQNMERKKNKFERGDQITVPFSGMYVDSVVTDFHYDEDEKEWRYILKGLVGTYKESECSVCVLDSSVDADKYMKCDNIRDVYQDFIENTECGTEAQSKNISVSVTEESAEEEKYVRCQNFTEGFNDYIREQENLNIKMNNGDYNLSMLLKDSIGQKFYTTLYGHLKLVGVTKDFITFALNNENVSFRYDGRYHIAGEVCVYPEQDDRDWGEWYKKNKQMRLDINLKSSKRKSSGSTSDERFSLFFSDERKLMKGICKLRSFIFKLNDENNDVVDDFRLEDYICGCEGMGFWNPMLGTVIYNGRDGMCLCFSYGRDSFVIDPKGVDMNGNYCIFPNKTMTDTTNMKSTWEAAGYHKSTVIKDDLE